MKEVILDTEKREIGSKGALKNFRTQGKVPGVLYGKDVKAEPVVVDSKTFLSIVEENGANVVINLKFKDGKKPVIIKSLQRDILTQEPIHIDFQVISLKDKVEVMVPIHVEGVADGVKNYGGLMEFVIREVKIEALPTKIPAKIDIDVTNLGLGQGITIADLPEIDGVVYIQEPSTLILHVVAPRAAEEEKAEDAAGAEAAQPEVISKGKKDKEGEEGEAEGKTK